MTENHAKHLLDPVAQHLGFEDANEMLRLIAAVDLSDPVNLAEFNHWKEVDGSKTGLLAAFPQLAKPANK